MITKIIYHNCNRNKKYIYFRFFAALFIALILLCPFALFAQGSSFFEINEPDYGETDTANGYGVSISTIAAPRRPGIRDMEITGKIPFANVEGNSEFAEILNERFLSQFSELVQAHQSSALSLNFSTEIFTSQRSSDQDMFISVVITMQAVSATTTTTVATTVINATTGQIIFLTEYHTNLSHIVNAQLRQRTNGRNFINVNIAADQPFYITENLLIIHFNEREIGTVIINLDNIIEHTIDESLFFVLPADQYSTIMVRLTAVIPHFGYSFAWGDHYQIIEIFFGEDHTGTLTIGKNEFSRGIETALLEAAAMIHESRTYVPLSFFQEILGIATKIDNEKIIFTKYINVDNDALINQINPHD